MKQRYALLPRSLVIAGLVAIASIANGQPVQTKPGTPAQPTAPARMGTAPKPPPWLSERWQNITKQMDGIHYDGALRLSFPLPLPVDRSLGISPVLVHALGKDAFGRQFTEWRVASLQSYLVPWTERTLWFQPLLDAPVEIDEAEVTPEFSRLRAAPRWQIKRVAPDGHVLRNFEQTEFHYRDGVLRTIHSPRLGQLSVDTQGGLVTRIRRSGDSVSAALFEANYDGFGRLRELRGNQQRAHAFEWDAAGRLRQWTPARGPAVQFDYENDLLTAVTEEGKPPRTFAWISYPDRTEDNWATATCLSQAGDRDIQSEPTSQGLRLTIRNRTTGERIVTHYNARSARIEFESGETHLVVYLKTKAAPPGLLRKIEDARGKLLEDYVYDDRGRLLVVKRVGEQAIRLEYDDNGRAVGWKAIEGG